MSIGDYFRRIMKSELVDESKTYDLGDACMVKQRYAEAEIEYKKYLDADPLDTQALLRMCRAAELHGRPEDALRLLGLARQRTLDKQDGSDDNSKGWPSTRKDFRQCRILALTYAMGDLLVEKIEDAERAKKLYANTLEELFGYPDVNPLRERLKRLEQPGQISISQAVENAQPDKIPFPES
jgi:tetratricopeptide (TPR) repeat protein